MANVSKVTGVLNAQLQTPVNAAVSSVEPKNTGADNGGGNIFVPTNPPQNKVTDTLTLSDDAKKLLAS